LRSNTLAMITRTLNQKQQISGDLPSGSGNSQMSIDPRTKIILGVDTGDMYLWAIDLVSRLKFPRPLLTLLHAASVTYPVPPASPETQAKYAEFVEDLGSQALRQAQEYAASRGLQTTTKLAFGRAADSMIIEGNKSNADLIALCAVKHGSWSNGYMGSATCALALYGDQSMLIAKTPLGHTNPIRAVLALDHSQKKDSILERFLQLSPRGIEDILIVSGYGLAEQTVQAAESSLPNFVEEYNRVRLTEMNELNGIAALRLRESGYHVTTRAICASPNSALQEAMEEFQGDLLMIGAVGEENTPIRRIGSVALHQLSSEQYSVWMIRN
jgi:nucleotide-binding universal stress UspA family protein